MTQFKRRTRLTEQQLHAIEIMSRVHGMSYGQIAEEVGISPRTLYNWRQDDRFIAELKRAITRNTLDSLPKIFDSLPEHIIRDGNAALLRVLLQANDMLTEKSEVTQISSHEEGRSLDDMRADIERFKAMQSEDGE